MPSGKVIGGSRAAEEGTGAAPGNHRGQGRAARPAPSHGRTARAPPPGVPAGRPDAPPARGRAAPSADRPRRAAPGAAADQSFSSAAARPGGFTAGPRRVSPAGIPPSPPSSLPAPGRRDAAPLSRPAAGRRRRLGSRGEWRRGSGGRGLPRRPLPLLRSFVCPQPPPRRGLGRGGAGEGCFPGLFHPPAAAALPSPNNRSGEPGGGGGVGEGAGWELPGLAPPDPLCWFGCRGAAPLTSAVARLQRAGVHGQCCVGTAGAPALPGSARGWGRETSHTKQARLGRVTPWHPPLGRGLGASSRAASGGRGGVPREGSGAGGIPPWRGGWRRCAGRRPGLPAGWCSGPAGRRCPGGGGRGRPEPPRGPAAREDGASAVQQRGGAGSPRPSAAAPARPLSFPPRGGSARSPLRVGRGLRVPLCPPVRGCARTAVPGEGADSKLGPQRSCHVWVSVSPPPRQISKKKVWEG